MSFKTQKLIWMLEDILEKEKELDAGIAAWSDEDGDPCDQAACDPSDQYIIGREIEDLWKEFKQELGE